VKAVKMAISGRERLSLVNGSGSEEGSEAK